MTIEEALRIKKGSILYTHSGEKLVVWGYYQNFDDPCVTNDFYFICIDSMFNTINVRYNELCGPELCDEEKMLMDWSKNQNSTPTIREAFMAGFNFGYTHKMRSLAEEQLQK